MSAPVSIEILDLAPVVERLADEAGVFRDVGSVADLAAAMAQGTVLASPTAMVMLMGAVYAPPGTGSGPWAQTLEVTVGVVIAVTLAGPLGAEGMAELALPLARARGALFGWTHPGTNVVLPFWLTNEGVEDFDRETGVLLYRLDFTNRVRIQEPV